MTAPTQEAMKAARELLRYTVRGELLWNAQSIESVAKVIETETNLPVLLESHARLFETLTHALTYFLQNDKLTPDDLDMLNEMGAELAKAKEIQRHSLSNGLRHGF